MIKSLCFSRIFYVLATVAISGSLFSLSPTVTYGVATKADWAAATSHVRGSQKDKNFAYHSYMVKKSAASGDTEALAHHQSKLSDLQMGSAGSTNNAGLSSSAQKAKVAQIQSEEADEKKNYYSRATTGMQGKSKQEKDDAYNQLRLSKATANFNEHKGVNHEIADYYQGQGKYFQSQLNSSNQSQSTGDRASSSRLSSQPAQTQPVKKSYYDRSHTDTEDPGV